MIWLTGITRFHEAVTTHVDDFVAAKHHCHAADSGIQRSSWLYPTVSPNIGSAWEPHRLTFRPRGCLGGVYERPAETLPARDTICIIPRLILRRVLQDAVSQASGSQEQLFRKGEGAIRQGACQSRQGKPQAHTRKKAGNKGQSAGDEDVQSGLPRGAQTVQPQSAPQAWRLNHAR